VPPVGLVVAVRVGYVAAVLVSQGLAVGAEAGQSNDAASVARSQGSTSSGRIRMQTDPELGASMAALTLEPVSFKAISGWAHDDHAAALRAFLASCGAVQRQADPAKAALAATCAEAQRRFCCDGPAETTTTPDTTRGTGVGGDEARSFFEETFTPFRVRHDGPPGLVTGYYEPVLDGSRERSTAFPVPVLRRPADLVNVVDEAERGAKAHALTHLRRLPDGSLAPYATRREIEEGALDDRGLELVFVRSAVELFFMQVQGSGVIRFADGTTMRLAYDGKNGHPYTSIGRYLIDRGHFTFDTMSLDALATWLSADGERGRQAMWQNTSYVFFRELGGAEAAGPLGAMSIPLSTGRSLAVDVGHHALGTPIWVASPALTHATGQGFARLMVAQDVGSAIRGPERGDIYFGSGDVAGKLAGITKHPATFVVLAPRSAGVRPSITVGP